MKLRALDFEIRNVHRIQALFDLKTQTRKGRNESMEKPKFVYVTYIIATPPNKSGKR